LRFWLQKTTKIKNAKTFFIYIGISVFVFFKQHENGKMLFIYIGICICFSQPKTEMPIFQK